MNDAAEERGAKRTVEELEASEPPKPKRIKVGGAPMDKLILFMFPTWAYRE